MARSLCDLPPIDGASRPASVRFVSVGWRRCPELVLSLSTVQEGNTQNCVGLTCRWGTERQIGLCPPKQDGSAESLARESGLSSSAVWYPWPPACSPFRTCRVSESDGGITWNQEYVKWDLMRKQTNSSTLTIQHQDAAQAAPSSGKMMNSPHPSLCTVGTFE